MKNFEVLLVLILFSVFGYSQKQITGIVSNNKNKPVANALIYLESINSGVKTDKKGFYKVELSENVETINVYSYKYGLLSTGITIENVVNFVYIDTKKSKKNKLKKGEDFDIAYSEEEQKYTANKISMVSANSNEDISSYNTIFDMIRGRVAGVVVSQNNRIRIRGVNSPNSTSEPLYVVDGTPVYTIDYILPINVKDIKILKGSDASIYGSRGANGVVVITTKS